MSSLLQARARPILALFPTTERTGGVQTSGRIAWEALTQHGQSPWTTETADLFCYCDGTPGDGLEHVIHCCSKSRSVLTALRLSRPYGTLLVWHVGLLKLIPFLRRRRARVATFLHGLEVWRPVDPITRFLCRDVDLFLTNNDFTWDQFVRWNPWAHALPHQTVLLGLAEPLDVPTPRPGTPPALLMLSRLDKSEDYKGHRELIAAWPRVLQQLPHAELWIAGDGDLRPALEHTVAANRLQKNVRFWGHVTHEEKEHLLSSSWAFALPSRGEGFGLVYLEAMRTGRPCIVSDADAGHEVVNPPEAGLAIDLDRLEDVAAATCRVLSDGPQWDAWSAQARARYEAHFTAEHFKDRMLAALRPLADASRD